MKHYKLMVLMGRFQPFHLGHQAAVQQALQRADHVLLLCGSSFQPANLRNPWDFATRKAIIMASIPSQHHAAVSVKPMTDLWYQDAQWAQQVECHIDQHMQTLGIQDKSDVACIGFAKDAQATHLTMFPAFDLVAVEAPPDLHATAIRQACFAGDWSWVQTQMTSEGAAVLKVACQSDAWQALQETYHFVKQAQEGWQGTPYPPIFTTADVVVMHDDAILVVRRKDQPGQGLLALPGGYLDVHETLADACWRELQEETALQLSRSVFEAHCTGSDVFDHPHRADIGRVITYVRGYRLPKALSRPSTCAGDDAAAVHWLPVAQIKLEDFAFDHYFIIQKFLQCHWRHHS